MLTQPIQPQGRAFTRLAYEVQFYPSNQLSPPAKLLVKYSRSCVLTKAGIMSRCNEAKTHICQLPIKRGDPVQWFKIHWEYNNIPTQHEWDKIEEYSKFHIEFRISPVCDGQGKIVLIGWRHVRFKQRAKAAMPNQTSYFFRDQKDQ